MSQSVETRLDNLEIALNNHFHVDGNGYNTTSARDDNTDVVVRSRAVDEAALVAKWEGRLHTVELAHIAQVAELAQQIQMLGAKQRATSAQLVEECLYNYKMRVRAYSAETRVKELGARLELKPGSPVSFSFNAINTVCGVAVTTHIADDCDSVERSYLNHTSAISILAALEKEYNGH